MQKMTQHRELTATIKGPLPFFTMSTCASGSYTSSLVFKLSSSPSLSARRTFHFISPIRRFQPSGMPSQNFTLTPEQQALSLERKRKRDEAQRLKSALQSTPSPISSGSENKQMPQSILKRNWLSKSTVSDTAHRRLRIMSWNVCTRILIRILFAVN